MVLAFILGEKVRLAYYADSGPAKPKIRIKGNIKRVKIAIAYYGTARNSKTVSGSPLYHWRTRAATTARTSQIAKVERKSTLLRRGLIATGPAKIGMSIRLST
jgi:hypothetical protein